jgi:hypothetical protein
MTGSKRERENKRRSRRKWKKGEENNRSGQSKINGNIGEISVLRISMLSHSVNVSLSITFLSTPP